VVLKKKSLSTWTVIRSAAFLIAEQWHVPQKVTDFTLRRD